MADRVERFIKENGYSIKLAYGTFLDRPYDSKAVWGDDTKIRKIMDERNNKESNKEGLTFIHHPVLTIRLHKNGCRRFVLKGRGSVNSCKNLYIGENTEIGYDFRFLLIEKYYGGGYSPSCVIGKTVQ